MDVIIKDLGLLINATLIATPPLLFAALGSCFSERCGVVNIGIEGMIRSALLQGPWLVCSAGTAGLLFYVPDLQGRSLE